MFADGSPHLSIAKLSSLQSLTLSGTAANGSFLSTLVGSITGTEQQQVVCMPNLHSLALLRCPVKYAGINALWRWFKRLPSLQHFTLYGMHVRAQGAAVLANRLALLTSLRSLNLRHNLYLTGEDTDVPGGLKSLFDAAAKISTLVRSCSTHLCGKEHLHRHIHEQVH